MIFVIENEKVIGNKLFNAIADSQDGGRRALMKYLENEFAKRPFPPFSIGDAVNELIACCMEEAEDCDADLVDHLQYAVSQLQVALQAAKANMGEPVTIPPIDGGETDLNILGS